LSLFPFLMPTADCPRGDATLPRCHSKLSFPSLPPIPSPSAHGCTRLPSSRFPLLSSAACMKSWDCSMGRGSVGSWMWSGAAVTRPTAPVHGGGGAGSTSPPSLHRRRPRRGGSLYRHSVGGAALTSPHLLSPPRLP